MRNLLILLLLISNFSFGQKILFTSNMATGDRTQGGNLPNQQNGLGSIPPTNRFYCLTFPPVDSIGLLAMRFQVKKTDTLVVGNYRSEVGTNRGQAMANLTYWYETDFATPSWQGNDAAPEVFFQINDSAGFGVKAELVHISNKYYLWCNAYPNGGFPLQSNLVGRYYEVGTATAGVIDSFVLNFFPSITSTGRIRLYRNGSQVFLTNGVDQDGNPLPDTYTINGPNASAIDLGGGNLYALLNMYYKCGMYKYPYNTGTPGIYPYRVMYVTKIKFGGIDCTIADFITSSTNYILTHKKPYQKP